MSGRLLQLACVGVIAWGCASGPAHTVRYETGRRAAATDDGLHRVKAYRTDALYVLPGADLGDYSHFLVMPLDIFYRPSRAGVEVHEFRPRERERFERAVRRELEAAFGSDSVLEPSDVPGPGVLRVRPQLVDLSLGVARRAAPGHNTVWTTTEFRLFLDLSDSVSGASVMRMVDFHRMNPSSLGFPLASDGVAHPGATHVTVMEEDAAIRKVVGNRARVLHEAFDRMRRVGVLPLPDDRAG